MTDNQGAMTVVTHDVVVNTSNQAPATVIGAPVVNEATVTVDEIEP